jgi:Zn finger protein HypA/HybF involved in hydrogenase expression
VVHAEWIDGCAIHNGKEVYKSIDCSHCEEVFKIESHDREYWKARFKVCPFCGAKMDGGNDDG